MKKTISGGTRQTDRQGQDGTAKHRTGQLHGHTARCLPWFGFSLCLSQQGDFAAESKSKRKSLNRDADFFLPPVGGQNQHGYSSSWPRSFSSSFFFFLFSFLLEETIFSRGYHRILQRRTTNLEEHQTPVCNRIRYFLLPSLLPVYSYSMRKMLKPGSPYTRTKGQVH